jgi:hypothetical protein
MAYKFLRAAGLQELDSNADMDTEDFIGQQLYTQVTVDAKPNGEKQNKVKTVWSVEEFEAMLSKAAPKVNINKQQLHTPGPKVDNTPTTTGTGNVSPAEKKTPNVSGKIQVQKPKPNAPPQGDKTSENLEFPAE